MCIKDFKAAMGCIFMLFFFSESKAISDSLFRARIAKPIKYIKSGIGYTTKDSLFQINFRFRMQNRVGYISTSETNFTPSEFDFRIRRLRLRFDGYIYDPRLTYYMQLSFSRADQDWDVSGVPNVVRDGIIWYNDYSGFSVGVGQTKLPGNRQRVVSSGDLQFADRSIVNAALTWDRDFGLFMNYASKFKKANFVIKTCISSGEGRNIIKSDRGLAYTGRVEVLPLGYFTEKGDYFEGDILREPKPKLAIAGAVHFNHRAMREGGQLGKFLYEPRDIFAAEADFVFKYKGVAITSEYIMRSSKNPKTTDTTTGKSVTVYVGQGVNTQLSYCFKKHWEIAVRNSLLFPHKDLWASKNMQQEYTIGVSKYLIRHKVKVQTDFTYHREYNYIKKETQHSNWQMRFQIELGI